MIIIGRFPPRVLADCFAG